MELNKKLKSSLEYVDKESFKDWVIKVLKCEQDAYRGVDVEFALNVMEQLKQGKDFTEIENNLTKSLSVYESDGNNKNLPKSFTKSFAEKILKEIVCKFYMYKPQAESFANYYLNNNSSEDEIAF